MTGDYMVREQQIEAIIAANYENCLEPLEQISKIQPHGKSMLKYSTRFHNYDKIGESLYKKNKPKTPDMIFVLNDTLFLVEFKSGRIEGIKKKCELRTDDDECQYVKWDIKLKAIEGGFIVLRKLVWEHMGNIDLFNLVELKKAYILVYDPVKNPDEKVTGSKRFHKQMNANRVRFGLRDYKKIFYNHVYTYTKEYFENWLKDHGLINHEEKCES